VNGLLSRDLIERVFVGIDWEEIRRQSDFPTEYNGYPARAMIAAHTLPYCLPIQSERALARELSEHELLQRLCGFRSGPSAGAVPTRATLWHFRTRHYGSFQRALVRGLVALVAKSRDLHFDLPFDSSVERPATASRTVSDHFELSCPRVTADVVAMQPPSREPRTERPAMERGQLRFEFPRGNGAIVPDGFLEESTERWAHAGEGQSPSMRQRVGLAEHVGLPAEVTIRVPVPAQILHMWFEPPSWLYASLHDKDRLSALGPSHERRSYAACNILVRRTVNGSEHVLLAPRLTGSGTGEYALPGGKVLPLETVEACASRELYEETGLHLQSARPVSCHRRRAAPHGPLVTSVGVLAETVRGEPARKESEHHGEWQWHPIDDPPLPLFAPTRLVLDAYSDASAPVFTWDDVEDASRIYEPSLFQPKLLESE
jgi:8-oxo-dGTP diphosphatase